MARSVPLPRSPWFPLPLGALRWLLLPALVVTAVAQAQSIPVVPLFGQRVWNRADGLPSNEINALAVDRTGFLWIATSNGLARFDGGRFQLHTFAPVGQPAVTDFVAVATDPAGESLWAAPRSGGLLRLHGSRFEVQTLPAGHAGHRVARLLAAPDGALWIAFEGGEVMRLVGDRPEIFGAADGLGPARATQIATDGSGGVWLANGTHLARYDAGRLQAVALGDINENVRIGSARQDGPWVLTRGWLHKVVDGRLAAGISVNASFNANSVQALLEDVQGAIWTGTRARGAGRLTLPGGHFEQVIDNPEDIGALVEDAGGNIWAGANGGGLVRVRSGLVRRFDKTQGLLESHTLSVCEDDAGTMWIANREGGVAFINEQGRVRTLAAPVGRESFVARSMAPIRGGGALAATSYGVLRAERSGLLPREAAGSPPLPPAHGQMRVTHMARNGDLWVALEPARLGRLRDGNWRVFSEPDGLPGNEQLQSIAEDAHGRIWIGTEGSRLLSFGGERFDVVPLTAPAGAGGFQAVHFDEAGTGWIATAGAGVLCLGATSGRNLSEQHGLPARNISQVTSDRQGNLWFGSPEGIFHVNRDELERFFAGNIPRVEPVILGADDGLTGVTCASAHQPSVWRSRDGLVWFATRQGVVAIDPRRDKVESRPLVVKIDAVRAGEASWPVNGPVRVPALTRTLELDYSVPCLSTPDRVRARVRLEGYDDEWMTPEARGLARYARLPPGEYRFVVEAHLAGVPGTSARASVPVIVAAAWWQTWWFRAGAAFAVLLLGGRAIRTWSHRRLRARLAELEHASALESERARIARNIHDDLGSGLTRISLLTQAANGDSRAQLGKIYQTVGDLTQTMDEIVWAVNPKNDNLEGFANYLVEYAQGFLTDAGIRCRVLLPETLPLRLLPAQFRHHLFLSCKETLNNVAKHAQATEVTVQLRVEANQLVISVADNGRGLGAAAAPAGSGRPGAQNGLANMRSRLAELGGTCELASSAAGTSVTFTAPLPTQPPAP